MLDTVVNELSNHMILLEKAYTAFKWERERLARQSRSLMAKSGPGVGQIDTRAYHVAKANIDLALRGLERFAKKGVELIKEEKIIND